MEQNYKNVGRLARLFCFRAGRSGAFEAVFIKCLVDGDGVLAVKAGKTQVISGDVDFVMPFPDSGNYAAIGYAQSSGIPLEMGVIRNHYVGRTFIQPSQSMRDFGVKVKLNPVRRLLKDKRVLIIVRHTIRASAYPAFPPL